MNDLPFLIKHYTRKYYLKKDVYHYKQKTRILLFFHRNPSRKDLANRVEKENASNILHLFSCI